MIRLIATDLDDTILPEGTFDLNPEYIEVIRELNQKGILFVAASGRHTSSIRRLLEPVRDEVVILGDFSWGGAAETNEVLSRLNGILCLISGNHDRFGEAKDFNAARLHRR